MKNKNSKINLRDKYTELAKNSLVRVQYSCSGNTTPIEEFDFINYRQATDADFPEIINLLAECELPQSDVSAEKQNFIIAEIDHKIVACAGFEAYNEKALFRSLAVKPLHRNMQIAQVLTQKVIESGEEQGISAFYLLTTTADSYFEKLGWSTIDRTKVPDVIRSTTEFSSICPSSAICMFYEL